MLALIAIGSLFPVTGGKVQESSIVLTLEHITTLYKAAPTGVETRWISTANSKDGNGKGDIYTLIAPNLRKVIFDQNGAGIITKISSTNLILRKPDDKKK